MVRRAFDLPIDPLKHTCRTILNRNVAVAVEAAAAVPAETEYQR